MSRLGRYAALISKSSSHIATETKFPGYSRVGISGLLMRASINIHEHSSLRYLYIALLPLSLDCSQGSSEAELYCCAWLTQVSWVFTNGFVDRKEWKDANDDLLATIPDMKTYISGFIGKGPSQQSSRLVSDAIRKSEKQNLEFKC